MPRLMGFCGRRCGHMQERYIGNGKMVTPFDPCPPEAEWRLVQFNDHYEVSEYGHLRRAVGGSNSKKGKLIKPHTQKNGYLKYGIWRDNKARHFNAHRLVALAFLPNP